MYARFVQRNALAGFCTVCQQLHCQRFRTNTILVIRVFPDLLDGDINLFGCMGVGKSCDKSVIGNRTAYFDCRAWNVPHMDFAALVLSWRQADSIKNAISMIAQTLYPHKELLNKNSDEKIEMIKAKGYEMKWDAKKWSGNMFFDQEAMNMQGTFIVRKLMLRKLSKDELENLPPRHNARNNPDLLVPRHAYVRFAGVILRNITNQAGYLFNGEVPQFRNEAIPPECESTERFFDIVNQIKNASPEKRLAIETALRAKNLWEPLGLSEFSNLFVNNEQENA